jgi:hypothetical protein
MLVLARCGKHAEAVETAGNLYKLASGLKAGHPLLPRKLDWLVQSACGFGLAADAVPADQPAKRAEYLAAAWKALQQAVQEGYANRRFLEEDPDLDPLRGDSRFQQILDQVRAGKK